MRGSQKDWLVRTRTGEVLGPFTQTELYEQLQNRRFGTEDEISPSGGYWVSAQVLNERGPDSEELTRTSTRTHSTTGVAPSSGNGASHSDDFTPTPEYARAKIPDVIAAPAPIATPPVPAATQAEQPAIEVTAPRIPRIVFAVVGLFVFWLVALFVQSQPDAQRPPTQAANLGPAWTESSFIREIYAQIRKGERKAALKQLTTYRNTPEGADDLESLIPLAALHITQQNSLEQARAWLNQVYQSQSGPALRSEALMWLGYSFLIKDKDPEDRAEAFFLESLQLNPKSPVARYNLGRAYLKRGKYLEALDYLQLAELENPDLWLIHVHKGNARALLGNQAEALKAFEQAVEKAPDRWSPHISLSKYLFRIGDSEGARRVMRTMFMTDPEFEILSPTPFGYYQEEVSYDEYRSTFNISMVDAPSEDREFGRIYLAYLSQFKGENAADEIKKLDKLSDRGNFFARILSLKIAVEHFVDEATLTKRLSSVPTDLKKFGGYAHVIRGEAQLRLGNNSEALSEFEKAVTIAPLSAAGYFALAQLLRKESRPAEAGQQIERLLSIHPDYIPALTF